MMNILRRFLIYGTGLSSVVDGQQAWYAVRRSRSSFLKARPCFLTFRVSRPLRVFENGRAIIDKRIVMIAKTRPRPKTAVGVTPG